MLDATYIRGENTSTRNSVLAGKEIGVLRTLILASMRATGLMLCRGGREGGGRRGLAWGTVGEEEGTAAPLPGEVELDMVS